MSRAAPALIPNAFALLILVGLALLAGYVGSQFTTPALEPWYAGLNKPAFNPPNWIFPVVWTTLFVVMGLATWLVWRQVGLRGGSLSLTVYVAQLGLNVGWSALFFGQQRPDLALMEIGALLLAILLMALLFARHSRLAGLLILPYLAWVGFAAYLNYAIVALNP